MAETLAHESAAAADWPHAQVRVDGPATRGRQAGRAHAGQAPDVDAVVLLPEGAAEIGRTLTVRIVGRGV